jgi:multidrug efflux pump subunit AcrA (membrane-fusion protein)
VIETAITKPSVERQLKFAAPGIIADVPVNDGDLIKVNQVLAKQDTRQDEWQLKDLLREAESNEKIDYNKADLDSKKVDLKRKQDLFAAHAASQTEVEQADLAVKLAAAQVNLAIMDHDQKGYEAKKEEVKIDQMTIYSPIDGIVEKVSVGKGEMGDPQARDGAIVVGVWNPLWLEMHPKPSAAALLHVNDTVLVRYEGEKWQPAKVIFLDKVDAASDTQMIRMELPNPENKRPPGLHMQVQLPTAVAAAK